MSLFNEFFTNGAESKLELITNRPGGVYAKNLLTPLLTFGTRDEKVAAFAVHLWNPTNGGLIMSNIEPKGAVHWIDHYVVGTNDMVAWAD